MDTAKGIGTGSMYSQNHAGFNLYRLELVHNLGLPPTSACLVRHYHKTLHFSQHIVLYYYTMWLLALLLCMYTHVLYCSLNPRSKVKGRTCAGGGRAWLTLVGMYTHVHTHIDIM